MVGGAIKIGCSSGCTLSGNVRDQTEISPLEPSQDRELFVNILFCFAPPAQFQSLLGCALCKSVGAACSWGQITVGHALCFQSSNLVNHTKAKCHKDVECLTSPKSPNILKNCRTVAPAHISGRSAGNHRTTTCFAIQGGQRHSNLTGCLPASEWRGEPLGLGIGRGPGELCVRASDA